MAGNGTSNVTSNCACCVRTSAAPAASNLGHDNLFTCRRGHQPGIINGYRHQISTCVAPSSSLGHAVPACLHTCMRASPLPACVPGDACLGTCSRAGVQACRRACRRACIHPSMCACVSACLPACTPARVSACMRACMRACVRACVSAHLCLPFEVTGD